MPFDAGMMAAVVDELDRLTSESKIEKIQMPLKDVVVIQLRSAERRTTRLLISCTSNTPRINLTEASFDSPAEPPMFCMLLRKHLLGSKIRSVRQFGFERALEITVDGYDELGYASQKYIIVEIMGKYSNFILCDSEHRITAAIRTIELSVNQKRPILPGMRYELPPKQDKLDPLCADRETFLRLYGDTDLPPDKFIMTKYLGISGLISQEIAFRAKSKAPEALWEAFDEVISVVRERRFTPVMLRQPLPDGAPGKPSDYSWLPIKQYGGALTAETVPSFGALLDEFFEEKEKAERIHQRAGDLLRLLTNIETRLKKKTALQRQDIEKCADKQKYKLYGDLIIGSIYAVQRGMKSAKLTDWSQDPPAEVNVPLDPLLSPSANAQKWYKKYNKSKTAEIELAKQIAISERELDYIYTVFDSLTRAETESDISDIRRELYESGYASRMKNYVAQKPQKPKPMRFMTSGGYEVLCGKNNSQNDYITTKLSGDGDIWFHVKNIPGSHVVIRCGGVTPPDEDMTQAAIIAATNSKAGEGENVAVDYTPIRYIKKPNGSRPGFVIYHTNKTAYVSPDPELCKRLRADKK